jgi:hypothetical protein
MKSPSKLFIFLLENSTFVYALYHNLSVLVLLPKLLRQNEMPSEVYPLITQYEADRGSLQRFYFVPGSPERRERFNQFYKDYLSRLQQLPFESFFYRRQGGLHYDETHS